jgi:hypothetical protein
MHTALISRQPVERVCATLRHAQTRAPAVPPSYSVVKSFPALPIQQSKAVTIALSVVNHASGLSEAPASVRLLAGSQSSHAPHPAQLRCLIDLGVFLTAFPQRVETREENMFNLDEKLKNLEMASIDEWLNDPKSYACPECGIVTQCYTNCPLQVFGDQA